MLSKHNKSTEVDCRTWLHVPSETPWSTSSDTHQVVEAFTFLMENIYVRFEGMVYQRIVGIPMGTNCSPLIADLFLFCSERDFMSNLHKS